VDIVRREWTIHLVMLLIGAVFMVESMRLGLGRIQRPGPGMLPMITGTGLSLVALYSLIKSLLATVPAGDTQRFFGLHIGNVVLILFALVAYVLLFPWLGYLLGTFILLAFLFRASGFQHWRKILLWALLTTAVTYLVFSYWLKLRFPQGILGF
jgi:putative tricarboxylic transport membrane protein